MLRACGVPGGRGAQAVAGGNVPLSSAATTSAQRIAPAKRRSYQGFRNRCRLRARSSDVELMSSDDDSILPGLRRDEAARTARLPLRRGPRAVLRAASAGCRVRPAGWRDDEAHCAV